MDRSNLSRLTPFHTLLYLCVLTAGALGQGTPVQLDSSDWRSYTRQEELPVPQPPQPITFQSREPAETNFWIADITPGELLDFSEVRSKFRRGDRSTTRGCSQRTKSGLL